MALLICASRVSGVSCFKVIVFRLGHQMNLGIITLITKMAKITFRMVYGTFAPIRSFVLCLEEDSAIVNAQEETWEVI